MSGERAEFVISRIVRKAPGRSWQSSGRPAISSIIISHSCWTISSTRTSGPGIGGSVMSAPPLRAATARRRDEVAAGRRGALQAGVAAFSRALASTSARVPWPSVSKRLSSARGRGSGPPRGRRGRRGRAASASCRNRSPARTTRSGRKR